MRKLAGILSVCVIASAANAAETFAEFRGNKLYDTTSVVIEARVRMGRPAPDQTQIRKELYRSVANSVCMQHLAERWEKKFKGASSNALFTAFEAEEWPKLEATLRRYEARILHQRSQLEAYTSATQQELVTPQAYYEKVTSTSKQLSGFRSMQEWVNFVAQFPDVDAVDKKIAVLPRSAKAAFEAYGPDFELGKFVDNWTLLELEKRIPGVSSMFTTETLSNLLVTSASLSEDAAAMHAPAVRTNLLKDARTRLLLPILLPEIKFYNDEGKKEFLAYWREEFSNPLAQILPANAFDELN